MANVSSFAGTLTLGTNKNPWTPEGFLCVYEVMMKGFSGCDGSYGVCLDEEMTENSATFLAEMLEHDPHYASIGYWGNGRYSAYNTFENFQTWTKNQVKYLPESEQEKYKKYREHLLKLMYDNEWYLEFQYVDEEGGIGFISDEVTTINAIKNSDDVLEFSMNNEQLEEADYTMEAYCRLVEGTELESCSMVDEACAYIEEALKLQTEEEKERLQDFVVEKGHTYLYPYYYIDSKEEIDKIFLEEWREYNELQQTKA